MTGDGLHLSSQALVAGLVLAAGGWATRARGRSRPAAFTRDATKRSGSRVGVGAVGAGRPAGGARWARRRDVRALLIDQGQAGGPRIVLGTFGVGGWWRSRWLERGERSVLAAEAAQSVAVIGPTQSGKTSCLAVPAIAGWPGPVVAASVKADLLRDTLAGRRRLGRVWCFDPGGHTGLGSCSWSPLTAARNWAGARRMAADLTEVARGEGTTADGEFWYATAAKLLAPLFFAAAGGDRTMADVVRWVDTQEMAEVAELLEALGCPAAEQAARASWQREERQRSSVYTTAETVLEPFTDLSGAERGAGAAAPGSGGAEGDIDVAGLLDGQHSLYICAPAHDQRRWRPLFVALVKQVLESAFERATRQGYPLDPPLLVVLDEAANITPLVELDGLAATCAGHGVQLITVWQDLAQISARYGSRAATVINNHRAKVFLSGTSDPATLDHASHLVGDQELTVPSVTVDAAGTRSTTTSSIQRRLLPPDALRQLPVGTGVLLYGSLPPVRFTLRPWWSTARRQWRTTVRVDARSPGRHHRRRSGA